jgi:hypothetical protein
LIRTIASIAVEIFTLPESPAEGERGKPDVRNPGSRTVALYAVAARITRPDPGNRLE